MRIYLLCIFGSHIKTFSGTHVMDILKLGGVMITFLSHLAVFNSILDIDTDSLLYMYDFGLDLAGNRCLEWQNVSLPTSEPDSIC